MDIMTFSLMTSMTALTGSHYEGCSVSYERVEMSFHCLHEHQYIVDIDFFGVRLIFISPMNTKSGIFTRGFATRENAAFGIHSMK